MPAMTGVEHGELRDCVERALSPDVRDGRTVIGVECVKSKFSTSYDTYALAVRFACGPPLKLFLKDFGVTMRAKCGAAERRIRELAVYRELLADGEAGAPKYYGSLADEATGRYWLLLEFIEGTPVGYCHLDAWDAASRALGQLHGYFAAAGDLLARTPFLMRHDVDFFASRADTAAEAVGAAAPALSEQTRTLVAGFGTIISRLADQRPSFVHGGCRPSNILINVSSRQTRTCIVDFEEAGVGGPLFDLAHLLDGIEGDTLNRLLDAYEAEAAAYGVVLPARDRAVHLIACYRLYMIVNLLSQSLLQSYSERGVTKLLGIGYELGRRVGAIA